MNLIRSILTSLFVVLASSAFAESSPDSNEVFLGKNFSMLVLDQEKDGKRGFRLTHNKPKKKNAESVELIQLGEFQVEVQKFTFEKGPQTLLYRFKAKGGGQSREILVLYSGLVSLLAKPDGFYFYVAEEYEKSIRYYSMFNGEPKIDALKRVVEAALLHPDSALVATRWAGKESEFFIYDSTRLVSE